MRQAAHQPIVYRGSAQQRAYLFARQNFPRGLACAFSDTSEGEAVLIDQDYGFEPKPVKGRKP